MPMRILFATLISLTLLCPQGAKALPAIYDADGEMDFITEGVDILVLDYLYIEDNGVYSTGTDYPYGKIWLILYEPGSYENRSYIKESEWDRRTELSRYELHGPSSEFRWADDDAVAFRNLGIHDWISYEFDRLVFRIMVEEPAVDHVTDTLMWGTIYEDDSYSTLEFDNDYAIAYFRTDNLPEITLPPSATFEEIWMEHEVQMDTFTGLELHARFEIDNMRSMVGRFAAFVHYEHNGHPVQSHLDDPTYRSPSDGLTIQKDFMPLYPYTIFTDFTLFVPYDAFPTSKDYIDYYISVEILSDDGNLIGSSESPVFSVLRPD